MGLVPAAVSPRMSGMLQNLRIHQQFIAILLLPLVLLADLAAGRIRSNVTEGVRQGWRTSCRRSAACRPCTSATPAPAL
jgi:hypothetical protein